jgi:hypothetical protein
MKLSARAAPPQQVYEMVSKIWPAQETQREISNNDPAINVWSEISDGKPEEDHAPPERSLYSIQWIIDFTFFSNRPQRQIDAQYLRSKRPVKSEDVLICQAMSYLPIGAVGRTFSSA